MSVIDITEIDNNNKNSNNNQKSVNYSNIDPYLLALSISYHYLSSSETFIFDNISPPKPFNKEASLPNNDDQLIGSDIYHHQCSIYSIRSDYEPFSDGDSVLTDGDEFHYEFKPSLKSNCSCNLCSFYIRLSTADTIQIFDLLSLILCNDIGNIILEYLDLYLAIKSLNLTSDQQYDLIISEPSRGVYFHTLYRCTINNSTEIAGIGYSYDKIPILDTRTHVQRYIDIKNGINLTKWFQKSI